MAKKKTRRGFTRRFGRRRRGHSDRRFPLLTGIPSVYFGLIDPAMHAIEPIKQGNFEAGANNFIEQLSKNWTGFSLFGGANDFSYPIKTYSAILMGYIGSRLAGAVGANKAIKRVPIVGKYIKL